jgi:hypothetical protein
MKERYMISRKKVTNPDSSVKNETKTVATRAKKSDLPASLCALLPSAEQLKQMAAAKDTSAQSSGGNNAASLDIPPALLNPLESLPRPLSLDEVKKLLRATDTPPKV